MLHLNKLESLPNEMLCANFAEMYPLHGSVDIVEYVKTSHFIDRQTERRTTVKLSQPKKHYDYYAYGMPGLVISFSNTD